MLTIKENEYMLATGNVCANIASISVCSWYDMRPKKWDFPKCYISCYKCIWKLNRLYPLEKKMLLWSRWFYPYCKRGNVKCSVSEGCWKISNIFIGSNISKNNPLPPFQHFKTFQFSSSKIIILWFCLNSWWIGCLILVPWSREQIENSRLESKSLDFSFN